MTNRRKFLEKSLLTIPFLNTINVFGQTAIKKPIVISTWDSGIPVNEAAMSILKEPKGRALDAVEKGANQIENTINCCVGLGGNPDREGKVTLDACIMDEHMNCGGVALWRI